MSPIEQCAFFIENENTKTTKLKKGRHKLTAILKETMKKDEH